VSSGRERLPTFPKSSRNPSTSSNGLRLTSMAHVQTLRTGVGSLGIPEYVTPIVQPNSPGNQAGRGASQSPSL
jgi:hypothetical protein